MKQREVEERLQAVMARLSDAREQEKSALDAAWNEDPKTCGRLLERLAQAHERYLSFAEVAEKALPLLQTLARTERLRREAVEHLDRLEEQSRESRRLRENLARSELERISTIPESVGERFDLSLLTEDQLRLIAEARAALGARASTQGEAVLETFSPGAQDARATQAPASSGAPASGHHGSTSAGSSSPEGAPLPPPEDQLLLEDEAQPPVPAAAAGPSGGREATPEVGAAQDPLPAYPSEPLPGLSDDDALDAMFEEALAANSDLPAESSPGAAGPAPAPDPGSGDEEPLPEGLPTLSGVAPRHPPGAPGGSDGPRASDPLDELLSRAGFEG